MKKVITNIYEYFRQCDAVLWLLTLTAVAYSFLLIASMQRSGEYSYLRTQIIAVSVGLAASVFISIADYRFLIRKWYIAAIVGIVLAGLVFVFGVQVSGTDDTAWINLPGGFSIQPSEFIKICFIITFSKHLSWLRENKMIEKFSGVLFLALHAMIPMAIIHVQGDDGTVLIFALMFLVMTFAAGVQLRYFVIFGGLLVCAIPIIWNVFMNEEHRNRVLALFDLDGNGLTNYGWQQYQGKVSIASGEAFGSGLFNGQRVEHSIVPEQENDFIFTVAGEELGFVGCMALLLILFFIILKVILNAKNSSEFEGKYICYGVFSMIASQTIVNIGMVLGFLPVVGITLPLFSSGGTSALSTLISLGLVQSVRYHNTDDMNKAFVRRGSSNRIRM